MKIDAIIPAAGVGKRFNSKISKQYYEINGRPILYHTLNHLSKSFNFQCFIIGCNIDTDSKFIENIMESLDIDNYKLVQGGKERFNTVYNCINESDAEYVLIHDAVRPLVTKDVVNRLIEKLNFYDAVICGLKVRDTVKIVKNNVVEKTVDREKYFLSHTPQIFKREKLIKGFEYVFEKGLTVTDEAQVMEEFGEGVAVVESDVRNLKVTYFNDIDFISKFL
ncbi:2-C-methyl-D-erythritol 4-phosphate cytidylyltransferase [Deferribacter desulfuricans SSM1]|uniref:2-C-methyl-D-erythritol 4-phosphate cytidylyltransferase n=1 Tax=Deferribacter desulfuricans (strain DSM 14783 / JCM 11476 / NBRC 101012 / SSM1) TaxID=639282 RepID=D3PCZ8_DEFDS|nr:2-C-methyl-D-erythritol 4-phosphate cytidylyltransferase [Deferribacter desulfuricans]BAI80471.1 2-C-methyl-D-erythritol 4-phosphate cytidylyltransferase [Deferribacter desulfuricans SSM1]